jgi:retron-type reverse transcriptase
MKRIGFLYKDTFTLDALTIAFHAASKHKHGKRACFQFEKHLAKNLDALYAELKHNTYKPQPYYNFIVYEPKLRRIFAPAFRDLVVQHAIYAKIGPIFDASFIDQSFACRVGYGTHKAAHYAQRALQLCSPNSYTLKLDIRKFFYRIDRSILRTLIERKIKDERLINLMMVFADYGEPKGIPIGNLLSQTYALIYLSPLDHFVKRVLKVKYYCRYVDDFILFGLTHKLCLKYKKRIVKFLTSLKLKLSKFTIASSKRGVNFVGYRTWANKRFIRRYSLYKYRHSVKQQAIESTVSILGHARQTHSLKYMLQYAKEHYSAYYYKLPKIYHSTYYS